ncbi:UNVERIFIED_CONTAM: hypothetical protein HDU68_000860 [Siphonaria sp. JEL0065]|nr:hypothetical protein HDU68_000860 [Siphonaria sp. JEL0065]
MITTLSQLPNPPRIRIAGLSGSGKSTLGKLLAKRLSIAYLEEDSIHFMDPYFTLIEKSIVQSTAIEFTASNSDSGFVTDGFWTDLNPILLPQINVMIELNYPLYIILWRLAKRTFWRCWTGEKLWGTEIQETFLNVLKFWDKDNIFRLTLTSWYKLRHTSESKAKLRETWFREGWTNDAGIVPERLVWKGGRLLIRFNHPRELAEWLNDSQ